MFRESGYLTCGADGRGGGGMARAGSRQRKDAPRTWRWFLAEYAVVFAGVLTALGAEQLASTLNKRSEVREARRALDAELAWNLAALRLRSQQAPCIERRLDELDRWADSGRPGGPPLTLARPVAGPVYLSFRTAVWRATFDVVANMPLEEKLTYAQVYDDLENTQAILDRESPRWQSLVELQWAGASTPERHGRIKGDIQVLRRMNAATKANYDVYLAPLQKLGVKPAPIPESVDIEAYAKAFCTPILKW